MKIAGLDPLPDDDVENLAGDALLAELPRVALDGIDHLALDEVRHVAEARLGIGIPGQLRALPLERLRDLVPHLELHVHDFGRDHRTESFLGGGPLDAPAARLAAVGGELLEAGLRLWRPGEAMLEGLRAQWVAVADLDPESFEKRGIDRLGGAGGSRLRGVLRQLAGPGGLELLLGANLDFVEPANTVLGPPG